MLSDFKFLSLSPMINFQSIIDSFQDIKLNDSSHSISENINSGVQSGSNISPKSVDDESSDNRIMQQKKQILKREKGQEQEVLENKVFNLKILIRRHNYCEISFLKIKILTFNNYHWLQKNIPKPCPKILVRFRFRVG